VSSFRKMLLAGVILAFIAAGVAIYRIGPRNIIGMLRYDQRREGSLKLGDKAPDVSLRALHGGGQTSLLSYLAGKPLIVVFGSYT